MTNKKQKNRDVHYEPGSMIFHAKSLRCVVKE